MEIKEIRIKNLHLLLKTEFEGDRLALAKKIDKDDANYLSQLLGGFGSFGGRIARSIEVGCGKPRGWMDVLQDNQGAALYFSDTDLTSLAERLMKMTEAQRKQALKTIDTVLDFQADK